jgi:Family of unknown function (DUF5329)
MMAALRTVLPGIVLALSFGALAADVPDQEIEHLLDFVAASGCSFVRNGSSHDSADAADHLRLKYQRGKRYADSAENFIDRLATESSWSGAPYTVDCNGSVEPTGEWLHQALQRYRQGSDPVPQ